MIDTPGMRELKPTGEEDVAESFADVEALAAQCKFRDCKHAREPGCAVRAAIEAGTLDAQRAANFFKLRDEVAGAADQLATRLAQKADARVQGKALGKRVDETCRATLMAAASGPDIAHHAALDAAHGQGRARDPPAQPGQLAGQRAAAIPRRPRAGQGAPAGLRLSEA